MRLTILYLCIAKFTSAEVKDGVSKLNELYRKQKNYKVRARIQSLILTKEGKYKKRIDLAQHLRIDYATLKRWTQKFIESGNISLSGFAGNVAIAFKYKGSDTESTSIQIDDVVITD